MRKMLTLNVLLVVGLTTWITLESQDVGLFLFFTGDALKARFILALPQMFVLVVGLGALAYYLVKLRRESVK